MGSVGGALARIERWLAYQQLRPRVTDAHRADGTGLQIVDMLALLSRLIDFARNGA